MESRTVSLAIRVGTGLVLAFLYIPLLIVVIYSFNNSVSQTWPITSFTTRYYSFAWHDPDVRTALATSLTVALFATLLAFFTTDAALDPRLLHRALREAVGVSLNRITVDGDTSTNRSWPSSSAASLRSPCIASSSSAGTPCRSCSSSRSRCRGS